jgi:TFIIF-interacting CTD phosphatase-like protein
MESSKKTIMTKKSNSNIYKNNIENKNENKKILVIDLDETLIHTSFQKINKPD